MLLFIYVYFLELRLFNELRPIQIKKIPLPLDSPVRLYLKRLVASASSFWALGNLRISMRESIRRDRGSAKDLFAATGVLQRKIQARQWLEGEGAEDGQLPAIAGCGDLPPLGQAARDFLQADAAKRPFPPGRRRLACDLMESKPISRTAFGP